MPVSCSLYNPNDLEAIKGIFTNTFTDSEGQAEGELIGTLAFELLTQTPAEDVRCFVATEKHQLVGSIIFSRLFFENTEAFILAPVAVSTAFQGKGIGQDLIRFGLNTLKENNVAFAVTYGDPKFYGNVGFQPIKETQIQPPMALSFPQGWLAQSLTSAPLPTLAEKPTCVAALAKPEYW